MLSSKIQPENCSSNDTQLSSKLIIAIRLLSQTAFPPHENPITIINFHYCCDLDLKARFRDVQFRREIEVLCKQQMADVCGFNEDTILCQNWVSFWENIASDKELDGLYQRQIALAGSSQGLRRQCRIHRGSFV